MKIHARILVQYFLRAFSNRLFQLFSRTKIYNSCIDRPQEKFPCKKIIGLKVVAPYITWPFIRIVAPMQTDHIIWDPYLKNFRDYEFLIISGSYAFLEFDEEDDARKAIDEMNHKDFKGQTLNVELGGQIKRAKVILGHLWGHIWIICSGSKGSTRKRRNN